MLEAISLKVKNIPCHKNSEYLFEKGITAIRGKNFSGKSVLFSTLGTLLFSTPPLMDKANQAKLLISKGSVVEFVFDLGGTRFKFTQPNPTGKSVRYGVSVNGDDLEFKTINNARDYMEKIVPITMDQFYSLSYLNVLRPHTLQYGSAPTRRKFFEDVFSLSTFENLYSKVLEKQRPIKQALSTLDTKSSMLADMPIPSDTKKDRDQLDKLTKKALILSKKQEKLIEIDTAQNLIRSLSKNVGTSSKKEAKSLIEETHSQLVELKKQQKAYEEASSRWKDYEAYKAKKNELKYRISTLTTKLRALSKKDNASIPTIKQLEKVIEKHNDSITSLTMVRNQVESYEESRNEVKTLRKSFSKMEKKLLSILPKGDLSLADLIKIKAQKQGELERLELLVERLLDLLDDTGSHKGSICPTCQQSVSVKKTKVMVKEFTESIDNLEIDLPVLSEALAILHAIANNIVNEPKEANGRSLEDFDKEITSKKTERDRLRKGVAILDRINNLTSDMNDLVKVEKPSNKLEDLDTESLDQHIEKLEDKLQDLKSDLSTLERIADLKKDLSTAENLDVKELPAIREKLNTLTRKRENLQMHLTRREVEGNNYATLKNDVEELKETTKDAEAYSLMAEAFGKNGLRVQQIERLSKMYIDNMNRYASLLFPSPIKFSIEYSSSRFDILAERQGKISDVQLLSGSESRCFQLLTVLSILPIIPSKLRTSFIVLDELETCLGKEMRKRFCGSFLPQLASIVDNIIVISPMDQDELFIDGSREIRMVPTKRTGENKMKIIQEAHGLGLNH